MDKFDRRRFFKRVAKGLPILILTVIPRVNVFSSPATDCKGGCAGTCTGLCAVGCTNSCLGGCQYTCNSSCQYTCNKMCRDACTGCQGTCKSSCKTPTIKPDSVKLKRNKQ